MLKRILSTALILVFTAASVLQAYSAETKDQFSRVFVNMPDIVVELKETDFAISDLSTVNASLNDENLTVEDFHNYTPSEDSSKVYMLVDVSESAKTYISNVKTYIESFASRMGEDDDLVLITFGTEVKTVLDGTESLEKINETIESIECNDRYTMLYDALDTIYQDSVTTIDNFTRKYAIVFTDCDNDKQTSITDREVLEKYSTHQLPLYVSAPTFASDSDLDTLGEIARASGGAISTVESESEFTNFTDKIDKVSIVKLRANSNFANNEEKNLSLTFDSYSFNINVTLSNSRPDTDAPEVESFAYDLKKNMFTVTFTEKVTDLTVKEAFSIEDADGKKWEIASVEALKQDDQVQLVMKEQILNGDYTITFKGITDCSQQKNVLEDLAVITVKGVEVEDENPTSEFPLLAIILIVATVVLISGVVVIVLIAKSNKCTDGDISLPSVPTPLQTSVNEYSSVNQVQEKHHIKISDAVRVRIKIKTGKVSEQDIEISIASSIIIGRSSACDIYIDDSKLSRQHFAVERINNELYITDLDSRNGTFINGIRIKSRRKIMNGDRIFAGLSEIIISFLK